MMNHDEEWMGVLLILLCALLLFSGCAERHTFSTSAIPMEWPQVYGQPLRDGHDRPIYSNAGGGILFFVNEKSSTFSVAEFFLYAKWPPPPFGGVYRPQKFRVRAVYRLNGLGRLPALGDTLRGVMTWYEWEQSGAWDTTYYHGRPLPDSIQILSTTAKAYPRRDEYYDLGGEHLGGATTLQVEAGMTTGGSSVGSWWNYADLAHEDSLWFWP